MVESKGNKKLDKKNNQKLRIFLVFLSLSFIFWTLIKLSKDYIADVEFELRYTDVPENKLIQNTEFENVTLTLKTTGFKLLRYTVNKKALDYTLTEVERKRGSDYFSPTSGAINFLQAQLSAETVVLNVEPDTLFFDLGVRKSKEVPVVSAVDFNFKTGFDFVKPIELSPSVVSISGPEKAIDTIEEVFTEELVISDIAANLEQEVRLSSPGANIELSNELTTVRGEVDKITDGVFILPFEVINLPRNYLISTYPKEVKVIFQVALKDYNKIPENSFKVQCDYKHSVDNNLDHLIPRIVEKPEIIFDAKVIPNKIEFLIKK